MGLDNESWRGRKRLRKRINDRDWSKLAERARKEKGREKNRGNIFCNKVDKIYFVTNCKKVILNM